MKLTRNQSSLKPLSRIPVRAFLLTLVFACGAIPLDINPGNSQFAGVAQAAEISSQLAAASDAITQFKRATGRFQNRLESVKSKPDGNPCADVQLQALQTQILMRYIQARDNLTAALTIALPDATSTQQANFVFSGDPDYQDLTPEQHTALTQGLAAFRALRYDDRQYSLLGQGCDIDWFDMFSEAGEFARAQAGEVAKLPETIAEQLDELMTPSEKHAAESEQAGQAPESEVSGRGWDAAGFDVLLRQFDQAYELVGQHVRDFMDRLDQLSACCREEMCHDAILTYSYAGAMDMGSEVARIYYQLVAMASPGLGREKIEATMAGTGEFPDVTDRPLEDQLAFAEKTRLWYRVFEVIDVLPNTLRGRAPECDAEDLMDAGRRVAEQGQDPESGLDAGAESVSGDPGDPGGGGEGTRFEKVGSVFFQEDRTASCGNVTMTLRLVSSPSFPAEVRPDGVYTISFNISWSTTGSQLDELGIGVFVNFLGLQRESETFRSRSGNERLSYTFRGSDVDFSQAGSAISVIMGGGVLCINGTNDDDGASTTISQGYFQVDKN